MKIFVERERERERERGEREERRGERKREREERERWRRPPATSSRQPHSNPWTNARTQTNWLLVGRVGGAGACVPHSRTRTPQR